MSQSTFIGGRQIFDGVLISNERTDWWSSKRNWSFVFKIDFEKAYDCVNRNFLIQMLRKIVRFGVSGLRSVILLLYVSSY